MYNHVTQKWRVKSADIPAPSSKDGDYTSGVASLLSSLNVDADAARICKQRSKARKRKGNLARKQPPAWDDSTLINPQPRQARPVKACCWQAKRPYGRRPRPKFLYRKSSLSGLGGGGDRAAHANGRCRNFRCRQYSAYGREPNLSNNQKDSFPPTSSCVKKQYQRFVCSDGKSKGQRGSTPNCQKRKGVAFQSSASGYGQGFNSIHNSQSGKTKCRKTFNASNVLPCCASTCDTTRERPRCCKYGCYQKVSGGCRAGENECCHQKTGQCLPLSPNVGRCSRPKQRSRSANPWKYSKGFPTGCISETFQYLADKHLSEDFQYPSCLAASIPKHSAESDLMLNERHRSTCPKFSCPSCKCQQRIFSDSCTSDFTSPSGGMQTSHPTTGSKSFPSCRYKDKAGKRNPKNFSFDFVSLEGCTKAMSNLCLKEKALIEKYGTQASEYSSDRGGLFSKRCSNLQTSPRWKAKLTLNRDYNSAKVPSPGSKARTDNTGWLKKNLSWNQMSQFDRIVSDNRLAYGSAGTCGFSGHSGGFSHFNFPCSTFSKRLRHPWSEDINISPMRQDLFRVITPCAELRLFNKYLREGKPSQLPSHSQPIISPGKRQSETTLENNTCLSNQGSLAKSDTPPWRKVQGGYEMTKDSVAWQNTSTTKKTPSNWTAGEVLESLPGAWKYKGFNFPPDLPPLSSSVERMVCHTTKSGKKGGGGLVEKSRGALYGSPYGVTSFVDRIGESSIPTFAANTGILSLLNGASKLTFPSACPVQTTGVKGTMADKPMLPNVSEWQAGSVAAALPMDSCLREEEKRLKRIGTVIGNS